MTDSLDRQTRITIESARLLDAYVHAVHRYRASNSALLTSTGWIVNSTVSALVASAMLSDDAAYIERVAQELADLGSRTHRLTEQARQMLLGAPRPQRG